MTLIKVDVNTLLHQYNLNKDKYNDNAHKLNNIMETNKSVRDIYFSVLKSAKKILKKNGQIGGNGTLIMAGMSTVLSLAVGGFVYWWWISRPQCKPTYPTYPPEKIPSPADLILNMFPTKWRESARGKDPIAVLKSIRSYVEEISEVLEFIDASKSTGKAIAVNAGRIVASTASAVATLGAGGDILISFLFTIKSALDTVIGFIESALRIATKGNGIRLVYDILNVDFRDGPFGVKCWIEYILNKYGSTSEAYLIACTFFNRILDKIAQFMGNLLSSVIPNNMGLVGIVVPQLIKLFKQGFMTQVESVLEDYYDQIPDNFQMMLQNPKEFKEYIKEILEEQKDSIDTYTLGMAKGTTANVVKFLTEKSGTLVLFIHKLLAFMFSMIQIFKSCKPQEEIDKELDKQKNEDNEDEEEKENDEEEKDEE